MVLDVLYISKLKINWLEKETSSPSRSTKELSHPNASTLLPGTQLLKFYHL